MGERQQVMCRQEKKGVSLTPSKCTVYVDPLIMSLTFGRIFLCPLKPPQEKVDILPFFFPFMLELESKLHHNTGDQSSRQNKSIHDVLPFKKKGHIEDLLSQKVQKDKGMYAREWCFLLICLPVGEIHHYRRKLRETMSVSSLM